HWRVAWDVEEGMEKVLLAARGAGVGGVRRRAVKHCMSIFCYRRATQLYVARRADSSGASRKFIWCVAPAGFVYKAKPFFGRRLRNLARN
ncbi:hypothetical protein A2U01_0055485, partial [Trifolium medium]|nr:hypothetical protein [Trifolium medium]